jgi:hypothetical protein
MNLLPPSSGCHVPEKDILMTNVFEASAEAKINIVAFGGSNSVRSGSQIPDFTRNIRVHLQGSRRQYVPAKRKYPFTR